MVPVHELKDPLLTMDEPRPGLGTEFLERRPITLLYAGWIPHDRFSSWPSRAYNRASVLFVLDSSG